MDEFYTNLSLFLPYGLDPTDLTTHCDGCQSEFSISHSFDCKKSGLITARHNQLRERVSDLTGKAFTPSHVHDEPLIYSGRAVKRTKATPDRASRHKDHAVAPPWEFTEQKGYLLIRDLCKNGTDSVHYMWVMNTDV